ncbi:MAG: hypothetical protein KAR42_13290 [candidate division Zixibacteria bacterium]|nr:hypothetical protein [candidate division Zixibacteria bacterium]
MTEKFEKFNAESCRKLFDFLYPDEESMTDQEIQDELKAKNIDTSAGMKRILEALKKRRESNNA